ncbi:T9SS type A sorting domain-containing protein [Algoriphagus hitonicola]|uniref:Por secretion system C-terminal sorting domain-containing protein n=1 Tax=Algoriphagus hitonicola TaxID=435880 RepID=A0A1I2P5K6_9BACT|nr:T9SS type A sorting domain-containing protein [Algoriphagus hitonicola]SFG10369.1 Por secretion system C-terminal sorting domain-containing protein [Algoriphagus hitonicola]
MPTKLWSFILPFFLFLGLNYSLIAQCTDCDVTVDGNNAPVGTFSNGAKVCITGNRTTQLNFNNRNNIQICIADGSSWNGDFNQLSGLGEIQNFGSLTFNSNPNGNWTITNYGSLEFNQNLNSNKTIFNFGQMTVNGDFNVNSNARFESNGTFSVSGNTNFNSNGKVVLVGETFIGGSVVVNSNTDIKMSGNLEISGALQLNSNSSISGINSNFCNLLSVGGAFSNNGQIRGNGLESPNSILYVNKTPGGTALSEGAEVGTCPGFDCVETYSVTTTNGFDEIYIFHCSDILTIPDLLADEEILDVEVALVAGAGGGGFGEAAGGGGAGGVVTANGISLQVGQVYPVAVGPGGYGSNQANSQGTSGYPSVFFGLIANGGGGGGSQSQAHRNGLPGGSGGGAGSFNQGNNGFPGNGGSSALNQGGNGGNGRAQNKNQLVGGGGGGAFQAGQEGNNNNPGNGGSGVPLSILNGFPAIPNAFAGGGGATGRNPAQEYGKGTGGFYSGTKLGGDGDHLDPGESDSDGIGQEGRPNTGSGGGAGSVRGGAGSAGKVIIRISYRILPLEFYRIDAKYDEKEKSVTIDWSMFAQEDELSLTVQRSLNQTKTWEDIQQIDTLVIDSSDLSFSVKDNELGTAQELIFYRIKAEDSKGKTGYSTLVSVNLPARFEGLLWKVFPNPIGSSEIQTIPTGLTRELEDEIGIAISDFSGKTFSFTATDHVELSQKLNEYIKSVKKGVYILRLSDSRGQTVIKLIK